MTTPTPTRKMELVYDNPEYHYRSNSDNPRTFPPERSAVCRIRVYWTGELHDLPVVVCTERPDNHGTSVTNAFERIATQLYQEVLVKPDGVHVGLMAAASEGFEWFEHYTSTYRSPQHAERARQRDQTRPTMKNPDHDLYAEHFARVEFHMPATHIWPGSGDTRLFTHPEWRYLPRAEVEAYIGQALDDDPYAVYDGD